MPAPPRRGLAPLRRGRKEERLHGQRRDAPADEGLYVMRHARHWLELAHLHEFAPLARALLREGL